ncbi:glycosyltransferase family 4 protein [Methanobacterium formicicum]|uniref:Group 1 glycosyl transferase n=1 Tax=Methanobacterium formicicum (strain DSM 3637 / PP1) TaxID=1204725 RepID=K2RUE9_METFP|nr:glycosyltransferase family 4 protein [Methanobacterium formicicum]EKF86360.1 group 1 glycosyl transferase [Methanobacterium formicicum DSM 3637]
MKNIKICIVSEYALPYLIDNSGTGGAELQMFLLAKGLSKRHYDVNFIALDELTGTYEFNGIKIFVPYNNKKNSGYTHFNLINLYKFVTILNKINADIYILRGGSPLTSIISFFAQLKNKIFIFSSSSDANVSTALEINNIKDFIKLPFRYGVKNSTQVLCQTTHQKNLLKKYVSKKGFVVRNMFQSSATNFEIENKKSVLWVGRLIQGKYPELYLKLALKLPNYNFKMICSPLRGNEKYYNKIKNEAIGIENLEFIGFVPHNEILKNFVDAALFVNTSASEGFPNTFLEAWSCGTPVCSLNCDPDKIISTYKLGINVDNFDELVTKTDFLYKNDKLRNQFSKNCIMYVKKYHDFETIIDQYDHLFKNLMKI